MKHKGCISEILVERDEYIVRLFRKLKRTCQYASMYDICEVMASRPVPRHFLSEKMAYIIWSTWKQTHHLPTGSHPHKRRLYESLVSTCERMKDTGLNNSEVIRRALDEPARCLGISPYGIFAILKKRKQK